MSGHTPDVVEVYRNKILHWVYLVANHYKDIPDRVNVFYQDESGVIHDDEVMTVFNLEKKVREENWIFVRKLTNQWFDPREGGMTTYS